jgi:hypothetical protein
MTKETILKNISESIWEYGTSRLYSLDPEQEGYNLISVNNKLTHYVLSWIDKGKKIKISFFSADKFGPTKNIGEIKHEEIINL